MKTIYRADDGKEFDSEADALKYENSIHDWRRRLVEDNLATYLANKSRLKACKLRRDLVELDRAWKNFCAGIPRSRYSFCSRGKADEFVKLCNELELAALTYKLDMFCLEDARKMIPKLNKALRDAPDDFTNDLLRQPVKVNLFGKPTK